MTLRAGLVMPIGPFIMVGSMAPAAVQQRVGGAEEPVQYHAA